MSDEEAAMGNPSDSVLVEVDPSYVDMGVLLVDEISREAWRDLGNLLYGRPGWSCRLSAAYGGLELAWTFGPVGEALFVIDVRLHDDSGSELDPEQEYALTDVKVVMHVYDHEHGADHYFDIAAGVESWLDANEPRHADRPRELRDMAKVHDWQLLKELGFDVDVDVDTKTGLIIATVRKLALTPAFGVTLKEALAHARDAIADAFGAPTEVASGIEIRAHLPTAASAAV